MQSSYKRGIRVARRLREIRAELGLSQAKLASHAGIKAASLAKAEQGVCLPGPWVFDLVVTAIVNGIDALDLIEPIHHPDILQAVVRRSQDKVLA